MTNYFTQETPLPPHEEFYYDGIITNIYTVLGPMGVLMMGMFVVIFTIFILNKNGDDDER